MAIHIRGFTTLASWFVICLGVVGYSLGFYFSTPPFPFGQAVLYSLGKIAVIIGPIMVVFGTLLYIIFHRSKGNYYK